MLWSDEAEVMEARMGSKITTRGKENRDNMHLQKTVKLDDATVNLAVPQLGLIIEGHQWRIGSMSQLEGIMVNI